MQKKKNLKNGALIEIDELINGWNIMQMQMRTKEAKDFGRRYG